MDGLTLLTKAGAGQITLTRESVRMDELVREAYADGQSLARAREIEVRLERCDEVSVRGDRHRLRQLLLNLTDNAIKYNHSKGTVTLALHRKAEEADLVISNTGPGIAAEMLPRVFDPFFRGDSSHSHAIDGCGLGLSIARWIVTARGCARVCRARRVVGRRDVRTRDRTSFQRTRPASRPAHPRS